MVPEDVGVVRDVHSLELELPDSLLADAFQIRSACLAAGSWLGTDSVLHVH